MGIEVPHPTVDVAAIRETRSGSWSLDVVLNVSTQKLDIHEVFARRADDGRLVVRMPSVKVGDEWRQTVHLPPSWFGSVWTAVAIAVESAEIGLREAAE